MLAVVPSVCSGPEDEPATEERTHTQAQPRIEDAVVRVDRTGRVRKSFEACPGVLEVRLARGHVWVHHRNDGRLSQIDPKTRRVRDVDVGEVAGIAAAGGDLRVTMAGNRIAQHNGVSGVVKRSFRVAHRKLYELGDAGFLEFVGDSIWLTVPNLGTQKPQALWRVDVKTGAVRETHTIGIDPTPPRAVGRSLWFITLDKGLVRFETDSGRYEAIPAGNRPWGYTTGAGSVWVGSESPGSVRRIDPKTGKTTVTIDTDPRVRGLGFGAGFVWVATESSLQRIDPKTNRLTRTTEITSPVHDKGPVGVVYLNGDVWVSVE